VPLKEGAIVLYSPLVSYVSEIHQHTTEVATDNRRRHPRTPGPFDGRRVGSLATPLRIFDLSEGGCFVTALHEQQPGIVFLMEIELPYEGWIRVKAETLYVRLGFGFAVRFTEMTQDTADRLQYALTQLNSRAPYDL
jgi:hypothetical protein